MLDWFRRSGGFIDSSPDEVAEILEDEAVQLVDVRTPGEYAGGHLPRARLIPVDQLAGRADTLSPDRPVVVYCRSGHRSRNAARLLVDKGFSEVHNMSGGIRKWKGEITR